MISYMNQIEIHYPSNTRYLWPFQRPATWGHNPLVFDPGVSTSGFSFSNNFDLAVVDSFSHIFLDVFVIQLLVEKKNKPKLLDISISIAICFVLQILQGLVNVQTFSHEQATGDVFFCPTSTGIYRIPRDSYQPLNWGMCSQGSYPPFMRRMKKFIPSGNLTNLAMENHLVS